jgi:DNA-binding transcriptional MerR regulator
VPFTVSEMVERIARPGQDKAGLSERIRHWTREGLLNPIGERNPGTGRHREYDDVALEDAALLNAMADMGLQIGTMDMALRVAQQRHSEWVKGKIKKGQLRFLQIDFRANQDPFPRLHSGNFRGRGFEKSIVFNLTELIARLKTEKD